MQKIYFHIGLGKTGTSFLQSAFAFNADLYRNNGLIYPDLDGNNKEASAGLTTSGNGIKLAAAGIPEIWKDVEPLDPLELKDSFDAAYSYLISSEWLSACKLDFFLHLNEIFSVKYECKYIVFVRDPSDFIASAYLQGLKTGLYSKDIEHYVDELIESSRNYLNLINEMSGFITIVNYDVHKTNLLTTFDQLVFGRSISVLPNFSFVNKSPSHHQSQVLRYASELGLADFEESMRYIESGQEMRSKGEPFVISNQLRQKIYTALFKEIQIVNNMLPDNEPIEFSKRVSDSKIPSSLLTKQDLAYFKKIIDLNREVSRCGDFEFILKYANVNDLEKHSGLPPDFNPVRYLLCNPDVVDARTDPVIHYLNFGINEGRKYQ